MAPLPWKYNFTDMWHVVGIFEANEPVLAAALAEVPQPPVARVRPPGAAQRPTLSSLPKRTPPHEEPLVSGPPFRSPRQQQQWLLQEKWRLMEEMRAGHLAELEARSYEG